MKRKVILAEIAEAIDSPVAYTSKNLQQLQAHAQNIHTGIFIILKEETHLTKMTDKITCR